MRINEFGQPIGDDCGGWEKRPFPEKIVILGIHCNLEPIAADKHAADLFSAHDHPDDAKLWTYLFDEKPRSLAEFKSMTQVFAATSDPTHFAVVDKKTGQAIGRLALMRIDQSNGVLEIGHVQYSFKLQHTAMATEAVYLLLDYAFNKLGYRRCEWKCDNFNQLSKNAAIRFGFNPEGIFRQAIITKGRTRDTAWFAIIDKQWPGLQQEYKRWLEPNNFNAQGQQLSRLNLA